MPPAPFFYRDAVHPPLGPDGLQDLRDELLDSALSAGLLEEQAWKLVAVADELISNLEQHGNAKRVRIAAEMHHPGPLTLRILDNGKSFNLVSATALAEEPDGQQNRGLGLWMVRQATRSLRQQRTPAGENEIILEF